jgi:hypothetical protein
VEDGHKSHELSTVQKASRKYRDNLNNYLVLAQNHQAGASNEIKELKEKQTNMMVTYTKTVKNFSVIFDIIKKIVIEKEIFIKERLKKTLQDEIDSINSKTQFFMNLIQNIENFKKEVSTSQGENDVEFISKYLKREELGKNVTNRGQVLVKIDPFSQFSAEVEVSGVVKQIQDRFFVKTETKQTPQAVKKKPIPSKDLPKSKVSSRPSNKTIPKPLPSLDWDNISAISRAHSDEDTLSTKSFDFNLLSRASNSKIITISGFSEKAISSVEVYDANSDCWSQTADCLTSRTQFAGIPYAGNVLIMGGKQAGKRVASCEELLLSSMTWKESEISLPSPRSGFASISLSSKCYLDDIYIVGGSDGSVLNSFQMFNLNDWISLPNLIYRRDELASVVGPDFNIYAIGGFGGDSQVLNTCEMYLLETETWEKVPNLNCPRRALSAVTMSDGIYVIGGYNGSTYLKEVEKYDYRMKKWVSLAPLNHPRCTLTACPDGQYIYAIGGFNGVPLNIVERYSVFENKWEEVACLRTERFMHSSVITNDFA